MFYVYAISRLSGNFFKDTSLNDFDADFYSCIGIGNCTTNTTLLILACTLLNQHINAIAYTSG